MLLLDERDVIDDEDAALADAAQLVDRNFRRHHAIAAAVKRPGAAERAVPRAAAREFNRCRGIEMTDEIFAAVAQQVAGGPQIVQVADEARWRTFAIQHHSARDFGQRAAVMLGRRQQLCDRGFAFAAQHAIDCARAMLQELARGE
jgi:hypothetical protein